jgi:hypothetical protein
MGVPGQAHMWPGMPFPAAAKGYLPPPAGAMMPPIPYTVRKEGVFTASMLENQFQQASEGRNHIHLIHTFLYPSLLCKSYVCVV